MSSESFDEKKVQAPDSNKQGFTGLESASSDFQVAAEFWRSFDLDAKRLTLDKQCIEMKDMKTASMAGRKRLNEITKSFRSKTKDEQVLSVLDVLKAYQEEIDQLSKRSKFSE
jgi:homeobox protein cut-like